MIELKNLGIRFGGEHESWIFRGASLTAKRGESIVILGPSGSGKSVLLKIAAGLLEPTEGSARIGTNNIGMLFQKNALFDSLTVEENLLFPLKERTGIQGQPAKVKAQKFLQAVGLAGTEMLLPDELSGGMQKRLGIARALIVEPEVIFYDEPTAGLDPITSRLIADLILELRRERGSTLLTVTNEVQRSYQLGDRIFLLANGRLTEGGTPSQVRVSTDPSLRQFVLGLKEGPLTPRI